MVRADRREIAPDQTSGEAYPGIPEIMRKHTKVSTRQALTQSKQLFTTPRQAMLTMDQIDHARQMASEGARIVDLATLYGVSPSSMSIYVRGYGRLGRPSRKDPVPSLRDLKRRKRELENDTNDAWKPDHAEATHPTHAIPHPTDAKRVYLGGYIAGSDQSYEDQERLEREHLRDRHEWPVMPISDEVRGKLIQEWRDARKQCLHRSDEPPPTTVWHPYQLLELLSTIYKVSYATILDVVATRLRDIAKAATARGEMNDALVSKMEVTTGIPESYVRAILADPAFAIPRPTPTVDPFIHPLQHTPASYWPRLPPTTPGIQAPMPDPVSNDDTHGPTPRAHSSFAGEIDDDGN